MELEIVGPRVAVDRNGTADRGGGQLVLEGGKLLIRARSIDRLLGVAIAIDHVQLVDLARLRAAVRFVDGQVWNVYSERGEDLMPFLRQLESAVGRPGLVRDPPRLSELVRAAATPARTRTALLIAAALLAYWPLCWMGALARPAGLLLGALGFAALLLGAAAFARRDQDGPALLERVRPWVSWPALAGALVALAAGVTGYADASVRAAHAEEQARAAAAAEKLAEAAAARQRGETRARRAEADALARQMLEALRDERFREAKALYDRIEQLVPGHDATKRVAPQLERALAKLDDRERVRGLRRGVALARTVVADPLACETAKRVADAHALLRRARPGDSDYDAAGRALGALERCRKRVRARFAQSAEDGRYRKRMLAAAQIENEVRRMGYSASVALSGRGANILRIAGGELNAQAAQHILAPRAGTSFEAARTEEGFARIEIRGADFSRDVRLKPLSAHALVAPVLEQFGLARPFTLAEAEALASKPRDAAE